MTEEEIKRVEDTLYNRYVTEPESLEKQYKSIAADAARQLMLSVDYTARFEFLGDLFIAKCVKSNKGQQKLLNFVISNESTRALAGNKYIPFTMSCEIDNNFSESDNYKAAIECFLRHVAGEDRAEELED